ncbi:MAG: cell division protein FtsA [Spirochaetales bacterium]|nr:cell division protein FtsA [Spirochaetales bacterium]
MSAQEVIVGLDIGTSKICAVIGEYNHNGMLEITGVGTAPSRGLRRGVVINIEATVKSIITAIEAAELMSGREVDEVYSGLAGGDIEGINSRGVVAVTGRGREIANEDVERVIDAAKTIVIPMDREVLHVIPQEFIVDNQGGVKNPIGMMGVRLEAEVHIITGAISSAQNIVKCINRSGFKACDLVLEPLASARAVLSNDEKELGVLLIDLGCGTSDVMVFLNGAPYYTEVFPLGGEQVTNDLSIMLKTPIEAAEKIKLQSGCCYQELIQPEEEVLIPSVGGRAPRRIMRSDLTEIIQSRMQEIYGLIRSKVDEKGFLKMLGGGVVLTGGGALLPGAIELAMEIFGLPTRLGYPVKMGGLVEEYRHPAFSTGVGLVMYADNQTEIREIKKPKEKKGSFKNVFDRMKDWFKEFI